MKYWFDTEFIEDGKTIDLISIGIIDEDGGEYYAINEDCDLTKASQWVKDNVIAKLPPRNVNQSDWSISPRIKAESLAWSKKSTIALEVIKFIKSSEHGNPDLSYDQWKNLKLREMPEFWAYYADYDWVVFCQLFGTMMDLPFGFPMYCRDIKQEADRLGILQLPTQEEGEHNALEDARWNKRAWEFLRSIDVGKQATGKGSNAI
jgi:hypothetical protein